MILVSIQDELVTHRLVIPFACGSNIGRTPDVPNLEAPSGSAKWVQKGATGICEPRVLRKYV